jgi:hypothetical protein
MADECNFCKRCKASGVLPPPYDCECGREMCGLCNKAREYCECGDKLKDCPSCNGTGEVRDGQQEGN